MYNIEKHPWGYKLTFAEFCPSEEIAAWVKESELILADQVEKFVVFIDMRTLEPVAPYAQKFMRKGQELFLSKGMKRSVVIVGNPIMTLQFKRIAKETGIFDYERYIDASEVENWEEIGMDWLLSGVEPDK